MKKLILKKADGTPTKYTCAVLAESGVWAVTAMDGVPGYAVTHMPTTMKVAHFDLLVHARRAREALTAWQPDYHADGSVPDPACELDRDVYRVCRWLSGDDHGDTSTFTGHGRSKTQ